MCLSLHRKEVISIFDDKAVKFENQNLRDYLLYYAFFKEKWLSPCDLICQAFPTYKNRVVFAFNTLVRLFNSPENIAFIEGEIRAAWTKVKKLPTAIAFEFVATFYNAIPDEALLYLKKKIDTLPEAHADMLKYDFEKHKNYHTIRSEIISILIGFKYTDYFIDAIQLALYCFERNNSEPMDIYFLFGERWGIGLNSYKRGYAEELVLLKQLQEYHKANNSILSAYCLIFAAGYSLRTQYSATEWNYDKSTIYQLELAACDEVFELRSLALESLFSVISDSPVRKYAVKMILEYPVYSASEFDEQVIAHDISILDTIFPRPIDTTDFSICEILHHFEDVCIAQGIDWPASLPKSNQNNTYRLYTTLSKECLRKGDKIENVESRRVDAIEQMAVILPHKVGHAARFAHGAIQTAQRRSEVIKPQLLHQYADAALCKAAFISAAVGIFVKLHIPRVGVAVSGSQRGGGFHTGNVLFGEFALSAHSAEPFHGLCHHGFCVVICQSVHLWALRHGENKRTDHRAVDEVHLEPVAFFKFGQLGDNLPVFRLCFFRDRFCRIGIITKHRRQLLLKRACLRIRSSRSAFSLCRRRPLQENGKNR